MFFQCLGFSQDLPTSKQHRTGRSRAFVFLLHLSMEMRQPQSWGAEPVHCLGSIINFSNAPFDKHSWRSVPKIREVIAAYCSHPSPHRRGELGSLLCSASCLSRESGPQTPHLLEPINNCHLQSGKIKCKQSRICVLSASKLQLFSWKKKFV